MPAGNQRLRRGFVRLSQWMGLIGPSTPARLSGWVVPTVDYQLWAGFEENVIETVSVTGNGQASVFVVPPDELWEIMSMFFLVGGTYSVNLIAVSDPVFGNVVLEDPGFNDTRILYGADRPPNIRLYPGQGILVNVASFSVTGDLQLDMRVRRYPLDPNDPS